MKASLLIKKILEKVPMENKAQYEDSLSKMHDVDLPDDFDKVIEGFTGLHTEDSAKSNKTLSEYHTNKFKDTQTKNMVGKLQAMGFEQTEIDDVLTKPYENRWESVLQISSDKDKKKYNLTESERIRQESERARQEKERADRLQAQNVELNQSWHKRMEEELLTADLRSLVSSQDINDNLPRDEAINLLTQRVKDKMQNSNAKIVRANGSIRLVQADDTALDFYDERNNVVTVQRFIEETVKSLNLNKKTTGQTGNGTPTIFRTGGGKTQSGNNGASSTKAYLSKLSAALLSN